MLQLKAYVQKQDFYASIDSTYSAKAVNKVILDQILQTRGCEITAIVVSLQVLMIFFIAFVVIVVIVIHGCSHKWPKRLQRFSSVNTYFKQKQGAILGVAVIGSLFTLYVIALDIAALVKRDSPQIPTVSNIHFKNKSNLISPFTLLYELPGIVLFFDVIGYLISLGMILCAMPCIKTCNNIFLFLCLSTLGFVCSLVTHSPFIAIAYLNDAYHAGSIFAYYTIIILVVFTLTEQLIVSCQKKVIDINNSDSEIRLQGTWILKKGPLHILDHQQQKLNLTLKKGTIEVSSESNPIQVDYEKIESDSVTLEIEGGTLHFANNESSNGLLSQAQEINLDEKELPIVQDREDTPNLMFIGLKPRSEQKLKIENDTTDENTTTKTVKLAKSTLRLQKAGKVKYPPHCTCMGGYGKQKTRKTWTRIIFIVIAAVLLFTLAVVVILTCYFVIIPINRSISDAPNRLVGIYESAIVLIGAYIAYKAFFKTKKYLESSVINRKNPFTDPLSQESKDKWKDMSDEEKLAQFYSAVVDIIADKKASARQPPQ